MSEVHENKTIVLALTVSYNGAPFCGFAKQPGKLTVQGSLEEALSLVFRHPVETVCSGRTDSGVHARGQVISFEIPEQEWRERSDYKVLKSLNALTHESIAIKEINERPRDFSARFSAVSREYRYFICTDSHAPLLMQDFCWHLGRKLDLVAMNKAAKYLIGEHDFKSFCLAVSAEGKPTHRYVASLKVEPYEIWGENLVCITIVGNAFLHSMVRTIVGTLVMVGLGKRKPEWMKEVLEARSRSAAGENAPAQGLVFWQVNYIGKRYYEPDANKTLFGKNGKASGLKAPAKDETKKPGKARSSFSEFFEEHRRHKPEELEFTIPRGNGSVKSGSGFSDVKTRDGEQKSVYKPVAVEKESGYGVTVESDETIDDIIEPAKVFSKPLTTTVEENVPQQNQKQQKSLPVIDDAEATGKLPLTPSAWETGKLEPVILEASKQDDSGDTVETLNDQEQLNNKEIAKQAMDNLKHLQKTEGKAFGKRLYPFQRK